MFDFQTPIARQNTHSLKWEKYKGRNILPFWVADMDFAAPNQVIAAIQKRLEHPVLGYTTPDLALNETIANYAAAQYDYALSPDWIIWIPGLVPALNVVARFASGNIIVMPPVYPPFLKAPILNNKKRIDVPLLAPSNEPEKNKNEWRMDFANLEKAFQKAAPDSVLFLCHPHNPVGRAWQKDELQQLADLATHYNIAVCSDEIHADLMLDNRRHVPFLKIAEQNAITLMAPSKTYNLPGLAAAFAIIPDEKLRTRFLAAKAGIVPDVNVLGLEAARAAFSSCDEWREALLNVLRQNREEVFKRINALPKLKTHWVEATYLAWIDARALNQKNPEAFFENHGIGLSNGADFGAPNFLRLNFGTTPTQLNAGLSCIESAF